MLRFTYYGIRCEDCEGTPLSSPLAEDRVAVYRLISVGFCTLFEWLTWWRWPSWRSPSPLEGIGLFNLASDTWYDWGSSVIPMGSTWGWDYGGRSWVPVSTKSYYQSFLGRGMLEDVLICQYFPKWSFPTKRALSNPFPCFSNFLGLCLTSCSQQWIMCSQWPHGTGDKNAQFWSLLPGPLTLHVMASVQDRLRFLSLVTIWVALIALPAGVFYKKYGVTPGVVVYWKVLEIQAWKLGVLWRIYFIVHIQAVVPIARYLEG